MADADHMSKIAAEHLAELEKQHRRIKHVVYNGVDLVFRKPTRDEVHDHAEKVETSPAEKARADEQLAQRMIVYVGEPRADMAAVKAAFLDLLNDYPYMTRSAVVGGALATLSGIVQDDRAKH